MSQLDGNVVDDKILAAPEEHPLLEPGAEEKLRKEIDSLRREIDQLREHGKKDHPDQPKRPRGRTLWITGLVLLVVLVAAFFLGWLPRHRREQKLEQAAQQEQRALPQVNYVLAQTSARSEELMLPGSTEALVDAPVLARADGYVVKRLVDIGDRVKKGQVLAVIAAPDLDQQVVQAQAQVSQSEAALRQATANLEQGRANEALARVTAARYENLVRRGAVSRQDNDTQQSAFQAQAANIESLNQAVRAANENVASAQANLQRLFELQSFERVTAPFDGVVTLRNTDVGALISNGSTLLFRIAQTDRLRTYINVPQPNAPSVRIGEEAELISPEFGSRRVTGHVTRTAEALDPATRTLLTEVQVANPRGDLRPGMFVQVNLKSARNNPPILVPGDAVIAGSNGTQVAIIRDAQPAPPPQQTNNGKQTPDNQKAKGGKADQKKSNGQQSGERQDSGANSAAGGQQPKESVTGTIHLQQIAIGRDYGAATEVYSGLNAGDRVIINPNDVVREGVKVQGTLTRATLDVQTGAPGAQKQSANSEKLQPVPSGEKPARQPSQMNKNRGPGY